MPEYTELEVSSVTKINDRNLHISYRFYIYFVFKHWKTNWSLFEMDAHSCSGFSIWINPLGSNLGVERMLEEMLVSRGLRESFVTRFESHIFLRWYEILNFFDVVGLMNFQYTLNALVSHVQIFRLFVRALLGISLYPHLHHSAS